MDEAQIPRVPGHHTHRLHLPESPGLFKGFLAIGFGLHCILVALGTDSTLKTSSLPFGFGWAWKFQLGSSVRHVLTFPLITGLFHLIGAAKLCFVLAGATVAAVRRNAGQTLTAFHPSTRPWWRLPSSSFSALAAVPASGLGVKERAWPFQKKILVPEIRPDCRVPPILLQGSTPNSSCGAVLS